MKVLVSIDGSKGSEIVLQEILERPWPRGTHFCLITVVDPFFFTHAPALFEETKEAAGDFLEEAATKFEAPGWRTNINVVLGNPRRAICKYADEWRADLVLVGSHGLNALERMALGSTVRAVLRHAKCSVQVVRAPKKEAAAGESHPSDWSQTRASLVGAPLGDAPHVLGAQLALRGTSHRYRLI